MVFSRYQRITSRIAAMVMAASVARTMNNFFVLLIGVLVVFGIGEYLNKRSRVSRKIVR